MERLFRSKLQCQHGSEPQCPPFSERRCLPSSEQRCLLGSEPLFLPCCKPQFALSSVLKLLIISEIVLDGLSNSSKQFPPLFRGKLAFTFIVMSCYGHGTGSRKIQVNVPLSLVDSLHIQLDGMRSTSRNFKCAV